MADPGIQHEVLVWTDSDRAPLVEATLQRMEGLGLHVLGVGGPRRGPLADLARRLSAPLGDDFRKMVIDQPAGYLLLATSDGLSPGDLDQVRRHQMSVLAIEPAPIRSESLLPADRGREEMLGRLVPAPWMRQSPSWLSAAEPQEAIGAIRTVRLSALGPYAAGSLFARLYDALDMLIHLLGVPDTVDASLSGPLSEPPQDVRALTGNLTAHLRFASGVSAVLHASDRSARWLREMVVMGTEGQLFLTESDYRLFASSGTSLDDRRIPGPVEPADLIAFQWKRLLEGRPLPGTVDPLSVVACCETALLSCRTGSSESTETLLRIRVG